jgi:hypothetical protein
MMQFKSPLRKWIISHTVCAVFAIVGVRAWDSNTKTPRSLDLRSTIADTENRHSPFDNMQLHADAKVEHQIAQVDRFTDPQRRKIALEQAAWWIEVLYGEVSITTYQQIFEFGMRNCGEVVIRESWLCQSSD